MYGVGEIYDAIDLVLETTINQLIQSQPVQLNECRYAIELLWQTAVKGIPKEDWLVRYLDGLVVAFLEQRPVDPLLIASWTVGWSRLKQFEMPSVRSVLWLPILMTLHPMVPITRFAPITVNTLQFYQSHNLWWVKGQSYHVKEISFGADNYRLFTELAGQHQKLIGKFVKLDDWATHVRLTLTLTALSRLGLYIHYHSATEKSILNQVNELLQRFR